LVQAARFTAHRQVQGANALEIHRRAADLVEGLGKQFACSLVTSFASGSAQEFDRAI